MEPRRGKYIRIEADGRVFVCVEKGGFIRDKTRTWVEVPVWSIGLGGRDIFHVSVSPPGGSYYLDGLGIGLNELSQILGLPVFDHWEAPRLWARPTAVGGSRLRVLFDERVVLPVRPLRAEPSSLIYPFSYFTHLSVAGAPTLVGRFAGKVDYTNELSLGADFPLLPQELAQRMGIGLVSS